MAEKKDYYEILGVSKNASIDELSLVEGINRDVALKIYNYFNKGQTKWINFILSMV